MTLSADGPGYSRCFHLQGRDAGPAAVGHHSCGVTLASKRAKIAREAVQEDSPPGTERQGSGPSPMRPRASLTFAGGLYSSGSPSFGGPSAAAASSHEITAGLHAREEHRQRLWAIGPVAGDNSVAPDRLSCGLSSRGREEDERRPSVCARDPAQSRFLILDVVRVSCRRRATSLKSQSGSGERISSILRKFPHSRFFSTLRTEPDALLTVAAWVKATRVTNVREPIILDATQSVWPIASADGIICIDVVHISPWEATLGLIKGAAAIYLRRRRSISTAHTDAKGSQRREQPGVRPEPSRSQPDLHARSPEPERTKPQPPVRVQASPAGPVARSR